MISTLTSLTRYVGRLFTHLRESLGGDHDDSTDASSASDSGPTAPPAEPEPTTPATPPTPGEGTLLADGRGDETLSRSELAGVTGLRPDRYVQQLLAEHGGRLRQREVSELTRLSASTTSRLLSEMEDDDQVTRVSVGREKIVCLPSAAPEISAGPPTDQVA
ncbi:hypothetical protein BRC89_10535 [Halobacteriales archaeon QS_4_70_19]|nr:MAG: hypothetical protein BRC89_10535 [Halobacteriales archaeon QS_4_70_19]